MAITANEAQNSRTITRRDGVLTGRTIWHAIDDTQTALNPGDAVNATGINVGDAFPNVPGLLALHYDTARVENAPWLMTVLWEYGDIGGGGGVIGQREVGYVELNSRQRAEWMDRYRDELGTDFTNIPANGNLSAGQLGGEVGGDPIDVNGKPVSALTYRGAVTILEVTDDEPDFNKYAEAAGARNNQAFKGAASGTLVYVGADSRTVRDGVWAITHEFVHDPVLFHLIQIPQLDSNGDIVLKPGPATVTYKVAAEVYWRQPFPRLGDFNLLSPNF